MLVLPKAPKGKAAPADDDDFESSYDEVRRRWMMKSCWVLLDLKERACKNRTLYI